MSAARRPFRAGAPGDHLEPAGRPTLASCSIVYQEYGNDFKCPDLVTVLIARLSRSVSKGRRAGHGTDRQGRATAQGSGAAMPTRSQPLIPPISHTTRHSPALTGRTESREFFTSTMSASRGPAFICSSVTGETVDFRAQLTREAA